MPLLKQKIVPRLVNQLLRKVSKWNTLELADVAKRRSRQTCASSKS